MRAIVVESPGHLAWSEVPDVSASGGEVVIDVTTAGVNRADLLQAAGLYPPPPGASDTLGLEVSGVISEVAAGAGNWAVGDQVCALLAGGGYAERVAVPAAQVMPIPAGVNLQHAAGLPEVAATVWSNLMMTAHLQPGQLVLLHGGASGIGLATARMLAEHGAAVVMNAREAMHLIELRSRLIKCAIAIAVGSALGVSRYGPEQLDFLRYRPVLLNTALKEVLGYVPGKTSAQAFDAFVAARARQGRPVAAGAAVAAA